ncbi:MAG: glycosyltransferase family 1 protein, partial [Saprospiraceae bacterium]
GYWLEVLLKNKLRKIKPDIFVTGDTYMPSKLDIPSIIVSHDLAFIHYPKMQNYFDNKFYNYFFPIYHKKATKIVAVSEFTKQDIVDKYNITKDKIEVIHNAANNHFYPVSSEQKLETRTNLTNGKPYFSYLGSIHPRKNLVNLIKGFDIFKKKTGSEIFLAIIGRPAWKTEEFYITLDNSPYKSDIITQQVKREDLPKIIGSSEALFYVSFFEGFGIPILEGFEANVPVVTSNSSSMPEVAGDAAILVDPHSPEEIAAAMEKIINDKNLTKSLVEKGKERLKIFNWDTSADKMYQVFQEVYSSKYNN